MHLAYHGLARMASGRVDVRFTPRNHGANVTCLVAMGPTDMQARCVFEGAVTSADFTDGVTLGDQAIGRPASHRPEADIQRQDVEESNARNADNGTFSRGRLILDGVVPNQDMRQRRRAPEQCQH